MQGRARDGGAGAEGPAQGLVAASPRSALAVLTSTGVPGGVSRRSHAVVFVVISRRTVWLLSSDLIASFTATYALIGQTQLQY